MPNSRLQTTNAVWQVPAAGGASAVRTSVLPSATSAALAVGIGVAVFAPWLAHLVPVEGTPLGATLLPMFYAPLLAALLLRLPIAVAVSMATPILSRLLTGMPPDPVLPGMVLHIALFVVAIRLLRTYHWLLVVPAAYISSLLVTGLVTAMMPDIVTVSVTATLQTGWPGLIVLAGLGYFTHQTLR